MLRSNAELTPYSQTPEATGLAGSPSEWRHMWCAQCLTASLMRRQSKMQRMPGPWLRHPRCHVKHISKLSMLLLQKRTPVDIGKSSAEELTACTMR